MLVVGGLVAVVLGALILGLVARGGEREARAQRAADLGALAGARAMHDAYSRLFEPVLMLVIGLVIGGIVILLYLPIFELAGSL